MWTLKKKRKRRALERLAGASAEALALVRALGSREAEALVRALACPQQRGPCVRVAGCPQQQQRRPPGGCASACAHLRWPDLPPAAALRPLPPPACASRPCCNPYHWSRLCGPESPPPPYCRFAADEEAPPEDRAPSEDSRRTERERPDPGSLATDGEDRSSRGSREWCRLAYWEMSDRVGPQYRVDIPSVNVFSAIPQGQGLCLDRLARDAVRPGRSAPDDDSVVRTRAKIGLGVTLSLEEDGVWVYNRSEQPVFVNSPTLDDLESRTYLVYRVPPGHCLCVFDPAKAGERPTGRRGRFGSPPAGPVDPNSVRISFAKGWGPKYTRQDVTACPCWLEVLLEPCR